MQSRCAAVRLGHVLTRSWHSVACTSEKLPVGLGTQLRPQLRAKYTYGELARMGSLVVVALQMTVLQLPGICRDNCHSNNDNIDSDDDNEME